MGIIACCAADRAAQALEAILIVPIDVVDRRHLASLRIGARVHQVCLPVGGGSDDVREYSALDVIALVIRVLQQSGT